jgi:hypothetical protein
MIATSQIESKAFEIIDEFKPVVETLGFVQTQWGFDEESDTLRVQFDDCEQKHAVQIDYDTSRELYTAKYCDNESDWQVCALGKALPIGRFSKYLNKWIMNHCAECPFDPDSPKCKLQAPVH